MTGSIAMYYIKLVRMRMSFLQQFTPSRQIANVILYKGEKNFWKTSKKNTLIRAGKGDSNVADASSDLDWGGGKRKVARRRPAYSLIRLLRKQRIKEVDYRVGRRPNEPIFSILSHCGGLLYDSSDRVFGSTEIERCVWIISCGATRVLYSEPDRTAVYGHTSIHFTGCFLFFSYDGRAAGALALP